MRRLVSRFCSDDRSYGTVQHAWDDNGGATDDNDYNDAVYNFSCTTVQTDPKTVIFDKVSGRAIQSHPAQ